MKIHNFADIHTIKSDGDVTLKLDISMDRFSNQYNKAQYYLDSMVMTHMIPFMPMVTGTFINQTKAMSASIAGTGYVVAAAPPYGRFLYEGKNMVGESTGSAWAMRGEKKVPVSQYSGNTAAKEFLEYNKTAHPSVTDHWYEAAKRQHIKTWTRVVKRMAGGG